jgi:hypothetical protein
MTQVWSNTHHIYGSDSEERMAAIRRLYVKALHLYAAFRASRIRQLMPDVAAWEELDYREQECWLDVARAEVKP